MIATILSPVSPPSLDPIHQDRVAKPSAGDQDKQQQEEEEEEIVDLDSALMHEPIVGVEQKEKDGHDKHSTIPLPSPPTMTPAQREKHNLTHLPPHPGCPICRASRTPKVQHDPTRQRLGTIPLLVGAYRVLRSMPEVDLQTGLDMRADP